MHTQCHSISKGLSDFMPRVVIYFYNTIVRTYTTTARNSARVYMCVCGIARALPIFFVSLGLFQTSKGYH